MQRAMSDKHKIIGVSYFNGGDKFVIVKHLNH